MLSHLPLSGPTNHTICKFQQGKRDLSDEVQDVRVLLAPSLLLRPEQSQKG